MYIYMKVYKAAEPTTAAYYTRIRLPVYEHERK